MNGKDLAKELGEFIANEYPGEAEVDLGEASAKIEEFIGGLEETDDVDDEDEEDGDIADSGEDVEKKG